MFEYSKLLEFLGFPRFLSVRKIACVKTSFASAHGIAILPKKFPVILASVTFKKSVTSFL